MVNPLVASEIEEVEINEEEKNRFEITDLDSLNWALRKLSAYNEELKQIQGLANAERQRINAWEEKESSGIKDSIQFFEKLVSDYHKKVLTENPEKKTLSTPYGKSKSTTSKAQPEKADEEKLFKFVEENKLPFVEVVTTKKLKWGDFKKTLQVVEKEDGTQVVIDENGQIVPGVAVKPQTTTFKVEI